MDGQDKQDVPTGSLLDDLAQQLGCEYLSDLCCERYEAPVRESLLALAENEYDTIQWSHGLTYLLRKNLSFSTVEQAKSYLESHPIGKKSDRQQDEQAEKALTD